MKIEVKKDKEKFEEDLKEDFYSQETREKLRDADALSNEEDGFMQGYEEGFVEDEEDDFDEENNSEDEFNESDNEFEEDEEDNSKSQKYNNNFF